MNKTHRHISLGISMLFILSVFLFFGLGHPYHIFLQEQHQPFEWMSISMVPGGFADWCGRFLTQFFLYVWADAAIMALLIGGVQIACWWLMKEKNLISFSFSFIPALVIWAFLCKEYSLAGTPLALIICLLAVKATEKTGTVINLISVPILYFLCGPIAIVCPAILFIQRRKAMEALASFFFFALSIFISVRVFNHNPKDLAYGIHHVGDQTMFPTLPWIAAALCIAVTAVAGARWPESRITTISWVGAACLICLAAFSVPFIGLFAK